MTVFDPSGSGQNVTSAAGGGGSNSATLVGSGNVLRIVNDNSQQAFIKVGIGSQTATTTDFLVLPHSIAFLQIGMNDDTIAVTTPGGAATIVIMRGSTR